MKGITLCVALCATVLTGPLGAQAPGAPPPSCDPVGELRFVCGQSGPEDLVAVPGTPWIIASAYGADGGIHLIDTKQATSTRMFPHPRATERHDRALYA